MSWQFGRPGGAHVFGRIHPAVSFDPAAQLGARELKRLRRLLMAVGVLALLSGIGTITLLLGVLIAVDLPGSAAWAIGLIVGVYLLWWGVGALMAAWALPRAGASPAATGGARGARRRG